MTKKGGDLQQDLVAAPTVKHRNIPSENTEETYTARDTKGSRNTKHDIKKPNVKGQGTPNTTSKHPTQNTTHKPTRPMGNRFRLGTAICYVSSKWCSYPEFKRRSKTKKSRNKYKEIQHDEVSSTTPSSEASWDIRNHISQYAPRNHLLIKAGQSCFAELESSVADSDCPEVIERQMETFASKLLEDEVAVHNKLESRKKKSEVGWIKTVLSSGTLSDKMAALTLLVQESPIHNLGSLESLVAMAKKKGKRECMMSADTLRELFISNLLPEDRKLRHFNQNPLHRLGELSGGNKDMVDRLLLQWKFESRLKDIFSDYLKALDLLLSTLVNKLGDPDYKLASKASHFLTKLVDCHPNMKWVVVGEVERLLYRPNIHIRAQYYCICFLNQLVLSHEEKSLAAKLISVYFSFFSTFVKKKEVDTKMMSALLTGVNRAYPYAKVDQDEINKQMDTLYRIVHIVNFNTSLQALMLLYHVMDASHNISDRYYTALYKKLSDPGLRASAKQTMFLNLLFRSMKKDIADRRVKAFIKRLLQVSSYQTAPFICGVLVMLGEVLKVKPDIINTSYAIQKFREDSDDEEEHFTDLPAPDSDTELPAPGEDSEEDVSDTERLPSGKVEEANKANKTGSSWLHKQNVPGGKHSSSYDPCHRNPLYCHADQECIWELEKLAQHYHPSVALFANRILKGEDVNYTGDPLQDFTLIRFLDRFVYKNPKKKEALPEMTGTLSKSNFKRTELRGARKVPINSKKYLERGEENIPVEEKFFFKYFSQKAEIDKAGKGGVSDEDSDSSSIGDDEFDDYLDKYESHLDSVDVDMTGLEMDFAEAVGDKVRGKKGKKKKIKDESEEEEDNDGDDDDDLSDEEIDFGDDEDFAAQFKDFDEDADDLSGDEGKDEEFDEEDIAFSDDDMKQIKWEMDREKKMKGDMRRKQKRGKPSWKGAKSHKGPKQGFKGQKNAKPGNRGQKGKSNKNFKKGGQRRK
ncbi:hypothetical protein FSP39_002965 [Pinctada imbricata]|uniref:CCAAT/enhancer-binding protein zeta n=1 Tax=Pinctada imbricata TaxID=66713 RepID=A0AA88XV81_PINIB|nr:hypothetical protein FSP39_002965 [Pinctada imbricata]